MARLAQHWVYGGSMAGVLLLILTPVLSTSWPLALTLIFLHLPAYMLHQLEEHDGDRFRRFFNETMGHGREVLSPMAVFFINIPLVWGITGASWILAATAHLGWGLAAVYLVLVNAIMHLGNAVAQRKYNPGLVSGVGAFIPLALATLVAIDRAGGAGAGFHAFGLFVALATHAGIIVYARRRMRALA